MFLTTNPISDDPSPNYRVVFKRRTFVPAPDIETFIESGRHHGFLQLHTPPATLEPLRALDIRVHGAQRTGNYYVSIPDNIQNEELREIGARALFALQPMDKVSARLIPDDDVRSARPPINNNHRISVQFVEKTPIRDFSSAIDIVGGKVIHLDRLGGRATLEIPADALLHLAQYDWIWWIDIDHPSMVPSVDVANQRIGADQAQPPPWGSAPIGDGLTGAGVSVGIWESPAGGNMAAVSIDHPDLFGRVTIGPGQTIAPSFHATNVAGIVAGDGTASEANGGIPLQWSGIAPEAQIVSWDELNSTTEMITSMMLFGTVITNHSFGPAIFSEPTCTIAGAYDTTASAYDDVVRSFGVTAFVSPGNNGDLVGNIGCTIAVWDGGVFAELPPEIVNAGYGSVTALGVAKNPVSVGARRKSAPPGTTTYSGRGPTTDGRLKPDIVAISGDAQSLLTMPSTPEDYSSDLGVSFAVPQATGAAALLLEHYRQDDPTITPLPAVYKAVLANTVADVGASGPDYSNGYGLIQIPQALAAADSFMTLPVEQGDVDLLPLNVDISEACALRIMAAWDDPPSMGPSMMHLINDIDLSVFSGGQEILPWVLTPSNPLNPAIRGVNSRDNVEQVTVENPSGAEIIQVVGTDVTVGPQDVVVHWYAVPCDPHGADGTGPGAEDGGGSSGCSCASQPRGHEHAPWMLPMLFVVMRRGRSRPALTLCRSNRVHLRASPASATRSARRNRS
ncbi:MAG: S8 family serine peptidase [Myxococcota bacterium]